QSWMYALLARFWMFMVMPTFLSCDWTAIAWALLVASRSVEVIAVNENPSAFPALARYAFALVGFGVAQTAEMGFDAYGPRGTGPTTRPWPSSALWTTCCRSSAHAI